jgi:hypothetical protein
VIDFAADQHAADLFFWEVWATISSLSPNACENGQVAVR